MLIILGNSKENNATNELVKHDFNVLAHDRVISQEVEGGGKGMRQHNIIVQNVQKKIVLFLTQLPFLT